MIRRELALKLAAMGSVRRWDPEIQVVYDNRRKLHFSYVAERLRRYDRALFMRFNGMAERWELFRWRGIAAPFAKDIPTIPAEEMARRSQFLWTIQNDLTGSFCEPDARTIRKVQLGDMFARFGSSSGEALADALDEEDRLQEIRDKAEREEAFAPMGGIIAFELRKITGHHKVFSYSK